jgi:prophage regulatory protein
MDANKYYSDKQLAERYGVARQTPWDWAKAGRFPKPVKLSPQCSRWYGQDVLDHEARLATEAA